MKKCPCCGFVSLSNQEKFIVDMMPTNSKIVADRLGISRKHASTVMKNLENLGVIKKVTIKLEGRSVEYRVKEGDNDKKTV